MTVEADGIVLQALLCLGIYSGITIQTPSDLSGLVIPSAGGGIQVSVFANLAQLTTNITIPTLQSSDFEASEDSENGKKEEECHLNVMQEFEIGLGAAAGASVFLGSQTWGPVPSAYTPIFFTTLADACAFAPGPVPTLEARQNDNDESTTTTETEKIFIGTECLSAGLLNCPNSLQSVHKYTITETLTATTSSGEEIDWDSFVAAPTEPSSIRVFGQRAMALSATTGQPVSYAPPPPTASSTDDDEESDTEEFAVSMGVIIGASVGGGVFLLVIIATVILYVAVHSLTNYLYGSSTDTVYENLC